MSYVSDDVIDRTLFKFDEAYLDMLGRLFDYYQLRQEYGWTFAQFVYKYDRGVYDNQFPYPVSEVKSYVNGYEETMQRLPVYQG